MPQFDPQTNSGIRREPRGLQLAGGYVDVVWYPETGMIRIGRTAENYPGCIAVGEFIYLQTFLAALDITTEDCARALEGGEKKST